MDAGNEYYVLGRDIRIDQVKSGRGAAVICISGFLSDVDEESGKERWLEVLKGSRFKQNPIYILRWDAKNLEKIGKAFVEAGTRMDINSVRKLPLSLARTVMTVPNSPLLATSLFVDAYVCARFVSDVLRPWKDALQNTEPTGRNLAEFILRESKRFILLGHSLGARVIYHCLTSLRDENSSAGSVMEVHLFGGAIDNAAIEDVSSGNRINWYQLDQVVHRYICNYYSCKDKVLMYLFSLAEGLSEPNSIGRNELLTAQFNEDVTRFIRSHNAYLSETVRLKDFLLPARPS